MAPAGFVRVDTIKICREIHLAQRRVSQPKNEGDKSRANYKTSSRREGENGSHWRFRL